MKKKAVRYIMGVDVGSKGAMVLMLRSGRIRVIKPIPLDPYELKEFLEKEASRILFARVEELGPRFPQGIKAAWGMASNYERMLMAFVMLDISHEIKKPHYWQKQLAIPVRRSRKPRKESYQDFKKRLYQVAKRMFPDVEGITQHTADAVLIAESCRREYLGKVE